MDYEVKADGLEASFAAVEAGGLTSEVTTLRAEVTRLAGAVEQAARASRRPALEGAKAESKRDPAMAAYLRRGITTGLETKSFAENPLGTLLSSDGGYAVPVQIDAMIQDTLRDISPIRKIANVVSVGTSNYRRLVTLGNVASGWVPEGGVGSRPDSATLKFGTVNPPMGELYANPSASQNMLDDVVFDLESWLASEIASEFARAEGKAFVSGTGTAQPLGFLTSPSSVAPDTGRPFGTLQYIPTGVAGDFDTSGSGATQKFAQDKIIDLIHTLRPAYRQNAVFVMNSQTFSRVRKIKDSTGQLIWQPSLIAGTPDTLFGYPVIDAEDMPLTSDPTAPFAIAFGDFKAGYLIAERQETKILRDPFTNKPYVNFYATKRVSGSVANSEAIKLLKFAVS